MGSREGVGSCREYIGEQGKAYRWICKAGEKAQVRCLAGSEPGKPGQSEVGHVTSAAKSPAQIRSMWGLVHSW